MPHRFYLLYSSCVKFTALKEKWRKFYKTWPTCNYLRQRVNFKSNCYITLSFHQKEGVPISMEWKNANNDSIMDVNKIMQDFSSISVTDSVDDDDGDD